MKSVTLFSNKKDNKQAARDLTEKASLLDFDPDLIFFYATLKHNGKYQPMLDIFHDEFGDIPQIGASVDGMIYPDDMHTDGSALVLCKDDDAKIRVEGIKENGAIESAEKLAKRVKCKNGAVVLHFPLVHVPNVLKSAEFFAKGYYYSAKCKGEYQDKQREYAGRFSNYCDKENIFYLPPTILKIFAEQTKFKVPIIGLNVMHTQVRLNSPSIFCNFEDIGGGIAALTIEKEKINAVYDDIFPDKGKTLEETRRIAGDDFTIIKDFKGIFEKNVLISLDGIPAVEAVKNLIYISGKKKEELLSNLDKGDYKLHRPYELIFFNKKTNGAFIIGIDSYFPFELFPFFTDISDYSEDIELGYLMMEDKFDAFISSLNNLKLKDEGFTFFCIDVGVVAAFGERVFAYKDKIKNLLGENYFGILSIAPSAYIPSQFQLRNYMSEFFDNTFFMGAGANACMEI